MRRQLPAALSLLLAATTLLSGQTTSRRSTTIDAIRAYPGFFHAGPVALRGTLTRGESRWTLATDEASLSVVPAPAASMAEGEHEVRGQLLDLGRLSPDDPRLLPLDLRSGLTARYGEGWPRPGEELLLVVTALAPSAPPGSAVRPPVRQVALAPERYAGQRITLIGQFRGRNLLADLPDAPPDADRTAFVLRSADAAVWVVGMRPRVRSGPLDPMRRIDTGRWLSVTGTVRTTRGLAVLDAQSMDEATDPGDESPEPPAAPSVGPAPEVIFSAPTDGETTVDVTTRVRVQFSRDLAGATVTGRVRLRYASSPATPEGDIIPCEVTYTPATRGLDIRPSAPLRPFSVVAVELLEGITAFDGAPLVPSRFTFTTGGA